MEQKSAMDVEEHPTVREFLELCTDNEKDWESFLALCAKTFQDSTAFRRVIPDRAKRRRFLPEYFKYLHQTEFSKGRAGLACLKRQEGNAAPEIIYGLVGVYARSLPSQGDKSAMKKIDPEGLEIAITEDQWLQHYVRDKITELAKELQFTWIYFPMQVAKSTNVGLGTANMSKAGELIGFDGIRRGMLPSHTPVVLYGVLDDINVRRFYAKLGMREIAHYHPKANLSCPDGSRGDTEEYNCVIIAGRGYPEADFMVKELRDYFARHPAGEVVNIMQTLPHKDTLGMGNE